MYRADETGIKRARHVAHLYRILRVGDVCADKRSLHGPVGLAIVTRTNIPGCRSDNLIVFDAAVFQKIQSDSDPRAASVEPNPLPSASSVGLV